MLGQASEAWKTSSRKFFESFPNTLVSFSASGQLPETDGKCQRLAYIAENKKLFFLFFFSIFLNKISLFSIIFWYFLGKSTPTISKSTCFLKTSR